MQTGFQKRHHKTKHTLMLLLIILLAVVITWGVGLFRFADAIPVEAEKITTRTDAIVVLTGGSGRLGKGIELLANDLADRLFVSGVYRGVDVNKLLKLAQHAPDELKCCVEIGHSAGDTYGNAGETAAWARQYNIRSLRIVTSNYHMLRSLLEFHEMMPDVSFISHPVFPKHVKRDHWWMWPGTASLIIGEYNKFLFAWLRIHSARLLIADKKS